MATTTARKRVRTRRCAPAPDGALQLARDRLEDAVAALTRPRPRALEGRVVWLDDRYTQLRDAVNGYRGAHGARQLSTIMPGWVDAMKLAIHIDERTAEITQTRGDTTTLLGELVERKWRPQDVRGMQTITAEILSWCKAIDDLFAPHPIYLPDPCPHCRQASTYRWNDEGQRVWTPALAVTAEQGCVCLSCHDRWPPDQLVFLGRVLGYRVEGLVDPLPGRWG